MCGICGWINLNGASVSRSALEKLNRLQAHRGPDGEGVFVEGPVGLGHRRLSILDIGGGAQPFSDPTGNLHIVYNGEIYNHLDLRKELADKGWVFRTTCDTETILAAYTAWGPAAVERFNGMFAFALFDRKQQRIFCARDRLGIKPFLYWKSDRQFLFASELKVLAAHPDFPATLDPVAIEEYFSYLYIQEPRTIYAAARVLPPGCRLLLDLSNGRFEIAPYWTLHAAATPPTEGEFLALLEDSTRLQLLSDVPVGVFLSGGIDSSLITALAAKHSPTPPQTFSIGIEWEGETELPFAREIARKYNTQHHEEMVAPDSFEMVERVVTSFDQPFADSAALPTDCLARMTAKHVKVALSGEGADELFSGYEWHRRFEQVRRLAGRLRALAWCFPFTDEGRIERKGLWRKMVRLLEYGRKSPAEIFEALRTLARPRLKQRFLKTGGLAGDRIRQAFTEAPFEDLVNRTLYAEATTYLQGDLLTKVDRTSMAHSLEARVPFLDHRLVEAAFALSGDVKTNGQTGKLLLRKVAAPFLTEKVRQKPKRGFGLPLDDWFRGRLATPALEIFQRLPEDGCGFFKKAGVLKILEDHRRHRDDHGNLLWALLVFYRWLETSGRAAASTLR